MNSFMWIFHYLLFFLGHCKSMRSFPYSCGIAQMTDRIVGGKNASIGQFPWIARLGYIDEDNEIAFSCAGSLITPSVVLTAGHCVKGMTNMKLIRLGENVAEIDVDCEDGICAPPVQDITVREVIIHPNYTPDTFENDIALIKLVRPAVLHDFVRPVCLPFDKLLHTNLIGKKMAVAGWGRTGNSDIITSNLFPNQLKYVGLPIVNITECEKSFTLPIHESRQICAGTGNGKDSCNGDSGGPATMPFAIDGPPRQFIMGVVSYGAEMCGARAAIYTNVSYYLDWINENL